MRSFLYFLARTLGDLNAIRRGRIAERINNRILGRILSKIFNIFKK